MSDDMEISTLSQEAIPSDDSEISYLRQEAIRRVDAEIGPLRAQQTDRAYYSLRISQADHTPEAAGPHLARSLRLLSSLSLPLHTVEGWMVVERIQRDYIEAIDAADAAALAVAEVVPTAQDNILPRLLERIVSAVERTPAVSALPREALSLEDAARFLGLDLPSVEHLIKTRKLPYVQVGDQRGRVIRVVDLRAFALQRRQSSGEEQQKRVRGRKRP